MDGDASTQSDYDLALGVACGEEEALRTLIREHGPRVRGFLKRRFPRVWEDAWQETLIRVVARINHYDPAKGGLGTWLLKLAQNCARSLVRGEKRHSCEEVQDGTDRDYRRPAADPLTPRQLGQQERRAEQIREAIAALPPKERRVIKADLAYWQGNTMPEDVAPAEDLAELWADTTANAIHQARHRARKKLREDLIRRGVYREGPGHG